MNPLREESEAHSQLTDLATTQTDFFERVDFADAASLACQLDPSWPEGALAQAFALLEKSHAKLTEWRRLQAQVRKTDGGRSKTTAERMARWGKAGLTSDERFLFKAFVAGRYPSQIDAIERGILKELERQPLDDETARKFAAWLDSEAGQDVQRRHEAKVMAGRRGGRGWKGGRPMDKEKAKQPKKRNGRS